MSKLERKTTGQKMTVSLAFIVVLLRGVKLVMNVGLIIHSKRIEKGLSLVELAKQLDVSHVTVLRWERGDVQTLKSDKCILLSKVLGIPLSEVLGASGNKELMDKAGSPNKTTLSNVGSIIRCKRKELGLSSVDVARRLGVSHGTVLRWEQGYIKEIKAVDLVAISKVLNLPISEILDVPIEQEQEILFKLRSLSAADQEEILAIIDLKLSRKTK